MTRKWFCTFTILTIAAIAVFVSNQITQAQRPDRGERRAREGAGRRGGFGGEFSPTNLIDNSWVDLAFTLKVDDETLLKARPIYQKHRDSLQEAFKEAREARKSEKYEEMRSAMGKMRETIQEIGKGFTEERNALLTEEQIAKLEAIEEKQRRQMRGRGGDGRERGRRR